MSSLHRRESGRRRRDRELAGIEEPPWLQGTSLLPLVRGEASEVNDVLFDPSESNDLSADPRHQGTLAELRGRLDEWMRATEDPLLDGPVPGPPGAWSNDPRQASPNDPTSAAPG